MSWMRLGRIEIALPIDVRPAGNPDLKRWNVCFYPDFLGQVIRFTQRNLAQLLKTGPLR
jgi:hypothetical protein